MPRQIALEQPVWFTSVNRYLNGSTLARRLFQGPSCCILTETVSSQELSHCDRHIDQAAESGEKGDLAQALPEFCA